ncbi:hypothetical protein [Kaistia sp. MMO-174]|uniref:hypothetical protein n=1 Tax=Kaistia sp. MMO-174 TaxID=3081256 RepID=UPI003016A2F6
MTRSTLLSWLADAPAASVYLAVICIAIAAAWGWKAHPTSFSFDAPALEQEGR